MAIKQKTLQVKIALLLLFLALAPGAQAQETGPVISRLSWQPVDFVSHYEVTVEIRTDSGKWAEQIKKLSETETFIECPLSVGNYRFAVTAYDLAGRQGPTTEWIYFEVRNQEVQAREELPKPQKAEAAAVQEPLSGSSASPAGPAPVQAGFSASGSSAETAPPLESEKSLFRLELAAIPLIILPFSDFNEMYATSTIQPLGALVRFSILPFVTGAGVFGLELSPAWNYLANDILHKSRYTHIFSAHAAVVWQTRPFNQKTALNVRLGGGLSFINSRFDFNDGQDKEHIDAWNPSLIVGVSFISFYNKSLFFNIGMDYYQIFTRDNMALNYLRPMAALGWWF